jgi:nicotinamide-nucleotide amidase
VFPPSLLRKARKLLTDCQSKNKTIVTAESCTGGLIAALLTEVPGSSAVFERGLITYSNQAKVSLLGINKRLLARHGAVSPEVAQAMVKGAIRYSNANIGIAVTGIAGPTGGTVKKPVGLVYIAVMSGKKLAVEECRFKGSRKTIRLASVKKALDMVQRQIL